MKQKETAPGRDVARSGGAVSAGAPPPVLAAGREQPSLGAQHVHVVGLGGTGVRGLVPLLQARGATVSGSDIYESPVLERMRDRGVVCRVGHAGDNVAAGTDLVLISAAVRMDNPEVQAANERRIAVIKYSQFLGFLMGEKRGIAVAGTHGKTTTSAMVAFTLRGAGLDPSFVIGGDHPAFGGSSHPGRGDYFVAEACEFDRSFLNLRPRAAVVTNIEEEHLDYFGSLGEIASAFRQFVSLLPSDGYLVVNGDDPNTRVLESATRAKVDRFSLEPGRADWWADKLTVRGERCSFQLHAPWGQEVPVTLSVPGVHNVKNALACAALSTWAGVSLDDVAAILGRFTGVRRRFDVLTRTPCIVVDDYAHHPTEIRSVLLAARAAHPDRRLVCVAQPHQHSRLRRLLGRFADALCAADEVLVTRVFRARDSDEDARSIQSQALVAAVRARGGTCRHTPEFEEALDVLGETTRPGDLVLFVGAGDVTELARRFATRIATPRSEVSERPETVALGS